MITKLLKIIKNLLVLLKKKYRFWKDYNYFIKNDKRFLIRAKDVLPCLNDNTSSLLYDRHYVYHTAWAARLISQNRPQRHIDISSDLRFVTLVSAFIPIEFYDYRPADLNMSNLKCGAADLKKLSFNDNSIESLSCMHVVEHVGLGRYGDDLDADGDIAAIKELSRVIAPKGKLYFVVPVGGEARIQFNAHRIYRKEDIINLFQENGLIIEEFTLIPDDPADGDLIKNPASILLEKQKYGCGCFLFSK